MYAKCCSWGLLVLTLVIARSGAAGADDFASGWYVSPSYHQTGLDKASNELEQPAGVIRFSSSFGDDTHPGLAAGYAFSQRYRVDLEFKNHSNDLKASGIPLDSSALESTTLVASLWRDFEFRPRLHPYVGLGFGRAGLKLGGLDDDVWIGQLGAGVQWAFTPQLALDLGYRYQKSGSDPELSGNSQKLTTEYAAHSVRLGVRWRIGGS